ncbi:hypothetical protein L1277_002584 [Okibacterium sp. HSC-33S16]|uniref:anti-sigma factor n=1 Tax=Okibacterium sp. HSC-33S16 TaxID=2910965 RepID=UPI0020A01666|nr:anti-sigma factor [Okibacterium sp. HSC-33S16]MCP2032481.1 hypothetical protein [Okibacterium sp. HSC-33S16]
MTHLDDEAFALYSFGEDAPDALQRKHLQTCPQCRSELAAFTQLVAVGRTLTQNDMLRPPDSVWKNIHAELGLSAELDVVPGSSDTGTVDDQSTKRHVVAPRPRVVSGPARSRRRTTAILFSAACLVVGVVAGVVGTAWLSRPDEPRLLAEAILEPFPEWDASGAARVETSDAGGRRIVIDVAAPGDGLTEVWLIDPETSGLISLGLLSGDSGSFDLPNDVDLSQYSIVDVSREPADGDPAHSGDSIVRGQLRSS